MLLKVTLNTHNQNKILKFKSCLFLAQQVVINLHLLTSSPPSQTVEIWSSWSSTLSFVIFVSFVMPSKDKVLTKEPVGIWKKSFFSETTNMNMNSNSEQKTRWENTNIQNVCDKNTYMFFIWQLLKHCSLWSLTSGDYLMWTQIPCSVVNRGCFVGEILLV